MPKIFEYNINTEVIVGVIESSLNIQAPTCIFCNVRSDVRPERPLI